MQNVKLFDVATELCARCPRPTLGCLRVHRRLNWVRIESSTSMSQLYWKIIIWVIIVESGWPTSVDSIYLRRSWVYTVVGVDLVFVMFPIAARWRHWRLAAETAWELLAMALVSYKKLLKLTLNTRRYRCLSYFCDGGHVTHVQFSEWLPHEIIRRWRDGSLVWEGHPGPARPGIARG